MLQIELRWIKLVSHFWNLSTFLQQSTFPDPTTTSKENAISICEPKWVSWEFYWDVAVHSWNAYIPLEEQTRYCVFDLALFYWLVLTRKNKDGNTNVPESSFKAQHFR